MSTFTKAIRNLRPGAIWTSTNDNYALLNWQDQTQIKPTEAEINTEVARLETPAGQEEMREDQEMEKVPMHLPVTKILFNYNNRIRALEGLGPLTAQQFLAAIRQLV